MSLNAHNNLLPCTYYTLSAMSPFTPVATSRAHAVSSNVNIVWSYVARYFTLKHSPRLAPVALDRLRGVGVGLPFLVALWVTLFVTVLSLGRQFAGLLF